MDPNAAVDRIVQFLLEGDLAEAYWALADLNGWLRKGGFLPDRPHMLALLKQFAEHVGDESGEVLRELERGG